MAGDVFRRAARPWFVVGIVHAHSDFAGDRVEAAG